ncbi:MAG: CoA ester lyase [Synergistales bacterium]|nr:CoA ester lyase [Synergistales bacterium]
MARVCRSMLYVPGNSPSMLQHAPIFGADSVLLDLEDAVAITEKDAARHLTARFLRALDFGDTIVTVRLNGADTDFFEEDVRAIVPCRPDAVRLPKCQSAGDVRRLDELIADLERNEGLPQGGVKIHAMIETARGVEHAYEIACAAPRVDALTLGGQDLTADMGVRKTPGGNEIFYARTRVVTAARAAGIDVFDTVWTDVNDNEGLLEETRMVIGLGFTGKAAIHPGQIEWIHRAFVPERKEVRHAERVVAAADEAERRGKGAVAVDGRMIDAPVVTKARHILELARLYGMEGGEEE